MKANARVEKAVEKANKGMKTVGLEVREVLGVCSEAVTLLKEAQRRECQSEVSSATDFHFPIKNQAAIDDIFDGAGELEEAKIIDEMAKQIPYLSLKSGHLWLSSMWERFISKALIIMSQYPGG